MKRSICVVLFCLLCWGTAKAQVEVFYLPESGFLRVSGEVTIRPEAASLSLLIFPTAHLTEFWADHLVEYSVQRYDHGTAVNFVVREVRPQTVTFAYEGLVEPKFKEAVLGPGQLWLPEFTVPVEEYAVVLQLPSHWTVVAGEVEDTQAQGAFQRVQLAPASGYPTITMTSTAAEPEEAPAAAELSERDETPLGSEAEVETDEPPSQIRGELQARVRLQINRFTRALSQRSLAELNELISPALQQEGLAQYLASLPLYYGTVSSEVLEVPEEPDGTYQVSLATERGPRFTAAMTWQETGGALQLVQFRLAPAAQEVPREIATSCEAFVRELQAAVGTDNQARLEALLAPDLKQDRSQVLSFLESLETSAAWSVQQVAVDPFAVRVLVPTPAGNPLLVELELTPGQYNWLLKGLVVVPLP